MKAVAVRVTGRVQGVGYRAWTAATAASLKLRGWVRNRRDGSVEALLAGDADAVEEMLARMQQGPPSARVAQVEAATADDPADTGFRTLPTG